MDQISFTPSLFKSERGILHILEFLLSAGAGMLAYSKGISVHTYWVWCMFTWGFCCIMTLIISIIELFKIDLLLKFLQIMDWDDFALGMAMLSTLMMLSASVLYPVFYAFYNPIIAWLATILSWLALVAYAVESVRGKINVSGSYLSVVKGFVKVLEAFVTCILFISLMGFVGKPGMYWCILVYILPFPVTLLIIVVKVLHPLKRCLACNLDKYAIIFLIITILLYITAAVIWPIYSFRGYPRPEDCPSNSCIWNILFIVTFMTYFNLFLYIVDLIVTIM